ncbi:MAG: hypothetical protein ACFFAN_00025 [Promethearchaeota archaeon]
MLLQANYLILNLISIVFLPIIYLLSVYLTRWYSIKQEYSEKWEHAIILNAIWFAVVIVLQILIYLLFATQFFFFLVYYIIALPPNVILGVIAVHHEKLYDIKSYKTCLKFVAVNLTLLFMISLGGFYINIVLITSLIY